MAKGGGSLYHPKFPPAGMTYSEAASQGLLREAPGWWMQFYKDGRKHRENCHTANEREARRLLNARLGVVATGGTLLPRLDKVTYREAREDLVQHYQTTQCRDLQEAGIRLKHLDGHFMAARLASIGPVEVTQYVAKRQAEGAANGTINREISLLSKMLKLAYRQNKLARLPMFDRLQESSPRRGFFERAQFEAVRRHLAPDYQVIVTLFHTYGFRLQEVLGLERRQLDLQAGTIVLDPGSTKNDQARTIYLTPELKTLLAAQLTRVAALERRLGRICPALFPHLRGASTTKRPGQPTLGEPIKDIRRTWAKACKAAGVPGKLVHDFRRTAIRNMVRAGVTEKVAMTVSGHKTRSVFERYNIVSPGDLQVAAEKIAAAAQK